MAAPQRIALSSLRLRVRVLCVSAAAACLIVGPGCSGRPSGARALVRESALVLTDCVPGEDVTGSFLVQNNGDQPLHVSKLEVGCGCAGAKMSEETIRVGGQAILEVTVRLKADSQPLDFPVRIFSNDPEAPVTVCTVRAEPIAAPLRTDPEQVVFGEVPVGQGALHSVKLVKPDGSPWPAHESMEVRSEQGLVQAHIREVPGGDGEPTAVLEIRARAELPPGPFRDTIRLWPVDARRPALLVVHGNIVSRLSVSPTTLFYGDVDRKAGPMHRQLLIRRTDDKPVSRLRKWTGPEGIRVEEVAKTGQAAADSRKLLQVTLSPAANTGDVKDGKLELWLEGESNPLTVRIMVLIKRTGASD